MIVIEPSAIFAYMNAGDHHHETVSAWLDTADDDLATTPLIVAEVEPLVAVRGGRAALSALRADPASGRIPRRMVAGRDQLSSPSPSATATTTRAGRRIARRIPNSRDSWEAELSGARFRVCSRAHLIAMKRARGAAIDLADLERLESD
jgi:predicted nucleic acid-binding protein